MRSTLAAMILVCSLCACARFVPPDDSPETIASCRAAGKIIREAQRYGAVQIEPIEEELGRQLGISAHDAGKRAGEAAFIVATRADKHAGTWYRPGTLLRLEDLDAGFSAKGAFAELPSAAHMVTDPRVRLITVRWAKDLTSYDGTDVLNATAAFADSNP